MPPVRRRVSVAPVGLSLGLALMLVAWLVPEVTGWNAHAKSGPGPDAFPPLHAEWFARFGPGTVPALCLAALAAYGAVPWSERLPWRRLLLASYTAGLAWMLALALVDGFEGFDELGNRFEYLRTARATDDIPATLQEYVDRIPFGSDGEWPSHVAGHPPGALLFFVGLHRVGLGSDVTAGLVVTVIAASTAVAVLSVVRTLGAEGAARKAAPFLVFGPAAVWQAVSADAMFAAVAAWGIAALALAAVRRSIPWSVIAGLLLGWCVMLSYGLPLLGVLAVTVLLMARSWRPLPVASLSAVAVVGVFGALGFDYLDALPVLRERYWDGIAGSRPTAYWIWANLAALLFAAGPMAAAGLAESLTRLREWRQPVVALGLAGWLMVALADMSLMSKAEVERIWLPFVPWLLLPVALLPVRWRRVGLVIQLVTALLVQHLLNTIW